MGIIVDACADKMLFEGLENAKIKYCKSLENNYLDKPTNTHPDMQIHFVDDFTAIVAPFAYEHYKANLPKTIKLVKGKKDPICTYPHDVTYNVARVGKRIIGNFKYVDEEIVKVYKSREFEFIDVKQGYTKCNLCIVDENSVITEDEGLFKALSQNGIDVLKITPGEVSLDGFKYGFLGGASGFISKNKLAFCGKIEEHIDYKIIKNFISSRKVDIISLSSTKMTDLGSIIYYWD